MIPDALILRFSDYEAATITEHRRVLRQGSGVWWGWWKKAHEPFRREILEQARTRLPIEIGLLNRRTDSYYLARCDDIAIAETELPGLPPPSQDATPPYYRSGKCPVWFHFTSIRKLKAPDWKERFVSIPNGDPTVYWIEYRGDRRVVLPRLPRSGRIEASGLSILHLSDLHFGFHFGFSNSNTSGGPLDNWGLIDILCDRLSGLNVAVGVLVISGDLSSRGARHPLLSDALPCLRQLARRLNLDYEQIIVVPGNHDIVHTSKDKQLTRRLDIEQNYRDFKDAFYGRSTKTLDSSDELESFNSIKTVQGWTYNIVGLNSARLSKPETNQYGYIGHRSAPWLDRLKEKNRQLGATDASTAIQKKILNIAVLHHHIIPTQLVCKVEEARPVSVTLDAGKIINDLQRAAVQLVLHGHQHVPFIGTTSRARPEDQGWIGHEDRLVVIGQGSTGARLKSLSDEMRDNTF